MLDGILDPVLVIDCADYSILYANRAGRQASGCQDPVAQGLHCYEALHGRATPCNGNDEPCPIQQIRDTQTTALVTHRHQDSQGRERLVEVSATPLFDSKGQIVHIVET